MGAWAEDSNETDKKGFWGHEQKKKAKKGYKIKKKNGGSGPVKSSLKCLRNFKLPRSISKQ
jgi:hypothetical protein